MEEKHIVRITGPYRKEGTKRKDGSQASTRWQVAINYADGSVSTRSFSDEDRCNNWINEHRVQMELDKAELQKDIPDYPPYDADNPLGWWVTVLALASQRLLAVNNDNELRQTLRTLSGVASAVGKLQNLDEIKSEISAHKKIIDELLTGNEALSNRISELMFEVNKKKDDNRS